MQDQLVFIKDPVGAFQECLLVAWSDRYDLSVGLEQVGSSFVYFWPEPAQAGLF
jgi:hypothetical protein